LENAKAFAFNSAGIACLKKTTHVQAHVTVKTLAECSEVINKDLRSESQLLLSHLLDADLAEERVSKRTLGLRWCFARGFEVHLWVWLN
jgi:hypothetical protein